MKTKNELCKLNKVNKVYTGEETIKPLQDVDLTVNRGDFVAIEGPSGTGKTTLLHIMAGLLTPTSGEVYVDGRSLHDSNDRVRTAIRSKTIGFIFQDTYLFQGLTVNDNLLFSIHLAGQKITADKKSLAADFLILLGLDRHRNHLPYQLSIGQRRRVAVARALINRNSLIIADEPTNDLDPYWSSQVIGLLDQHVKQGNAVVLVTHHQQWATRGNKRYRMDEGRLLEQGVLIRA